mmetsp:Transcript_39085/g.59580  ORF Transcript_39085/g.59580 Transcript_39085/m.59580 type:complete len:188 (+) Transcript_39085:386-949(+)
MEDETVRDGLISSEGAGVRLNASYLEIFSEKFKKLTGELSQFESTLQQHTRYLQESTRLGEGKEEALQQTAVVPKDAIAGAMSLEAKIESKISANRIRRTSSRNSKSSIMKKNSLKIASIQSSDQVASSFSLLQNSKGGPMTERSWAPEMKQASGFAIANWKESTNPKFLRKKQSSSVDSEGQAPFG